MPRRRAAAIAVLVASAPLILAACSKPAPQVALYANGTTQFADASVYCFEGQSIDDEECAVASVDPPELVMRQLDWVGIDVPSEIADNGYVVEVGGRAAGRIQQSTYFTVPLSLPDGEQTTLRVVALSAPDETADVTGVWRFALKSGES